MLIKKALINWLDSFPNLEVRRLNILSESDEGIRTLICYADKSNFKDEMEFYSTAFKVVASDGGSTNKEKNYREYLLVGDFENVSESKFLEGVRYWGSALHFDISEIIKDAKVLNVVSIINDPGLTIFFVETEFQYIFYNVSVN